MSTKLNNVFTPLGANDRIYSIDELEGKFLNDGTTPPAETPRFDLFDTRNQDDFFKFRITNVPKSGQGQSVSGEWITFTPYTYSSVTWYLREHLTNDDKTLLQNPDYVSYCDVQLLSYVLKDATQIKTDSETYDGTYERTAEDDIENYFAWSDGTDTIFTTTTKPVVGDKVYDEDEGVISEAGNVTVSDATQPISSSAQFLIPFNSTDPSAHWYYVSFFTRGAVTKQVRIDYVGSKVEPEPGPEPEPEGD